MVRERCLRGAMSCVQAAAAEAARVQEAAAEAARAKVKAEQELHARLEAMYAARRAEERS